MTSSSSQPSGPTRFEHDLSTVKVDHSCDEGLLATAQAGDRLAFERLVYPYWRELQFHCFRMLGSSHDAEEGLQETLLRAWRGLPRFNGRRFLRAWLYKIATNVCIDLGERKRRVVPIGSLMVAEPYPDDALLLAELEAAPEACCEAREDVELAFMALQQLPSRQRATLILRDVLGFSAGETAELLGATLASTNSALSRARKRIREELPEQSQQSAQRCLAGHVRGMARDFAEALHRGDIDAMVTALTKNVEFTGIPESSRGQNATIPSSFKR